jgi:hypothetical protein
MRTVTASFFALTVCLAAIMTPIVARASVADQPVSPDFSCSGNVHAQAIGIWEHSLRDYTNKQITNGLGKGGDVYVLYNTQSNLQAFVEMTRRCKDRKQIGELVRALNPAFAALRPLPDAPTTRGWVCTGGHTCTPANHLLGKEVQLCSAQFLGLLGAVATNIVETIPEAQRTATEKTFVVDTAAAISTQLDNWLTPAYFKQVTARTAMTSADAKDGQSKYFFLDRDLWFMTSLSDLAELNQSGIKLNGAGATAFKSLQTKHAQIGRMFNLFIARTTLTTGSDGSRAEMDRGYWRNYTDSKYAGYSAAVSPVICQKNARGLMQKTLRVESKPSYIDPNLGWDFSHARRLVPALDTFVRNRSALIAVFGYRNASFDPMKLQHAFANQIIDIVWNKDKEYPLFSNFWDGSNGWYRAGYENGTGGCRPGQGPYTLTNSFPQGSFQQWGAFNNTIRALATQLYTLANSAEPKAVTFINKYYPTLQKSGAPSSAHNLATISFLSSMVGT